MAKYRLLNSIKKTNEIFSITELLLKTERLMCLKVTENAAINAMVSLLEKNTVVYSTVRYFSVRYGDVGCPSIIKKRF